jgi:flavodoxin
MRKIILLEFILGLALLMTACGGQEKQDLSSDVRISEQQSTNKNSGTNDLQNKKILIAYFSRLENTDTGLDEIVQGGGPYGSLGSSWKDADIDALSSASITVVDGQAQGNVQTIAQMIQNTVGGELFAIKTNSAYPADYEQLIEQGEKEKGEKYRPELASHVEDMEEYEVVFLGYPNWWYDMPMAVYSFLEEYDFTGKKVIPFATSAGSGFSDTIDTIEKLIPEAEVVRNGLHIPMDDVEKAQPQIEEWLK